MMLWFFATDTAPYEIREPWGTEGIAVLWAGNKDSIDCLRDTGEGFFYVGY